VKFLTDDERNVLPNIEKAPRKIVIPNKNRPKKPSDKIILTYDSSDRFVVGHIKEINRAYTHSCYTSVFIIVRKLLENLIVNILKEKYPKKIDLFFDTSQGRNKDFSVVLESLFKKRTDFGMEQLAVKRLHDLAKDFKDNSNNKTHSLYHLVRNSKEIDQLQIQDIFDLVMKIEKVVGIRT
jgi:hypothetical protein